MMRFSLFPLLALALVATGCTGVRPGGPAGMPGAVVGPTWNLTMLGTDRPLASDASITFSPDGRVSGSTGCNRFTGQYTLGPTGALSIMQVGSTRMACEDMTEERRVLDALAAADRATVVGSRLLLTSGASALLAFEAARTNATVSGTVAYRERVALPPDAVVEVRLVEASRADAASETIAAVTVDASGRQVPIPFSLGYDTARIDPRNRYALRAEIRSATGELMWITDPVVPALGSGMATTDVLLTLTQAPGSAPTTLIGPTWQLAEIRTVAGVVLTLDAGAPYAMVFGRDGRYSGQADCNRIGGGFAASVEGRIGFTESLATLAACPEGSAAGDMLTVLSGADRYSIDGARLTLRGPAGTLVFTRG